MASSISNATGALLQPRGLEALLRSNDPPLGVEREQIDIAVSQLKQELSMIDERVEHLKDELDVLDGKREEISASMQKLKTAGATVRYLPTEILKEIFEHTVVVDSKGRILSLDTKNGPWLPSNVCKRWREVALTSPALWVNIGLVVPRIDQFAFRHSFLLGIQLARSANMPLSVEIDYSLSQNEESSALMHPYIIALVPTTLRWRRLHLRATTSAFTSLKSSLGLLPNLEEVFVRGLNNIDRPIVHCFQASQRLVSFRSFNCRDPIRDFPVPWNKLEKLWIGATKIDLLRLIENLRGMQNLQSLRLGKLSRHMEVPESTTSLVLPRLQRLALKAELQEQAAESFLKHLQAPQLNSLETAVRGDSMTHNIISFLGRQDILLDRFGFTLPVVTNQNSPLIREMFSHMPILTSLDVDSSPAMFNILRDFLTLPADQVSHLPAPLLPQLRRLVHYCKLPPETPSEYFQMVLSRGKFGSLKSVKIHEHPLNQEFMDSVKTCRSAGIKVEFWPRK